MDDNQSIINQVSRTELESHANMTCVGKDSFVISDSGKVMEVNPFTPDYEAMKVKLVDAVLLYDCSYTDKTYFLLAINALPTPSMDHKLIPLFMLREARARVNDIPTTHKGVFPYFLTSKLSAEEFNMAENVYTLAPNRWNPHASAYANCEQSMLDWEGNMTEKPDEIKIILADIQHDEGMTSFMMITSTDT
eukprot:768658-Ditylum_brightwellii.AAC.1